MNSKNNRSIAALLFLTAIPASSQTAERYALILDDVPVAARHTSREEMFSPAAMAERRAIDAAQQSVRGELEARRFAITGASSLVANAIFVLATPDRVAELAALPGVVAVAPLYRYRPKLNQATPLLGAPAAWGLAGGMANAGKGVKIGILDTGIDQNHPSLTDASLTAPQLPGGARNSPSDPAFTNTKVVVARSYVKQLAGVAGTIDPAVSRPDDYSARDHVGHGTAVATCAAGNASTGTVSIAGMAPGAWLGSYKVIGSPGVNDAATGDVLILALEDALADGMDVIVVSLGFPAFTGPLDTGAACGKATGVACDVLASAFEAAAQKVPILAAAGDEGANGWVNNYPTFNTISSPADAPSVIAVGGVSNAHGFTPAVRLPNLSIVAAQPTDSSVPNPGAQAAPLVDVAALGNGGYACTGLPAGSMTGVFALIERGPGTDDTCPFASKMAAAVAAGASGVVFYDLPGSADFPLDPTTFALEAFSQPAVYLANSDGVNLKAWAAANPGSLVVIDPAGVEMPGTPLGQLVYTSSLGPSLGVNGIKPDLLAVSAGSLNGDTIFTAAQTFDPLGALYSATGYVAASGTSFAAPLAAGAAAMVKQAHPSWTALQIRSALIDTATQDVTQDEGGDPVNVLQTGAGKVAANLAIRTNVTAVPSTLSFGAIVKSSLPAHLPFVVANMASGSVTLKVAVVSSAGASGTAVAVDKISVTLAAAASSTVTLTLSGSVPAAGTYYGAVTITGGAVPLTIPWMYLVEDTVAANFTTLAGDQNDVAVGKVFPDGTIAFQIADDNGVPMAGQPVSFMVDAGSAPVALSNVSAATNKYGIAYATPTAGSQSGSYSIDGCLGPCGGGNPFEYTFSGNIRNAPALSAGGIVSAASTSSAAIAPGSYISLYGTGLSDATGVTATAALPLSIGNVSVSFDVPSAGISAPGHLVFVSAGQINAQVPWELQGQTSAQVKVTINGNPGNVATVAVANYAPAFFEYPIGSGMVAAIDPVNASNPIIAASTPATRGDTIALFANGLGPVNNRPVSGAVASAVSLATTATTPVVTIGGQNAPVAFSGLTPGLPGLYQINATVPAGIGAGNQPVVVSIGGVTSKTFSIALQ